MGATDVMVPARQAGRSAWPLRGGRRCPPWLAVLVGAVLLSGCGGGGDGENQLPAPSDDPGLPAADFGAPSASRFRDAPRAVVVLVHGGGWKGPLPDLYEAQIGPAKDLRRQGFAVLNLDYRSGAQGLRDVLTRYDQARRRYPDTPICLYGQSAGATLALLVAEQRPETSCVISQAGPTDLRALADQPGGAETSRLAIAAFGRSRLREFSPIVNARLIRARVLQIAAANDPLVPLAQPRALARVLRRGELIELPAGGTPFVHSKVDGDALVRSLTRLSEVLDDAASRALGT